MFVVVEEIIEHSLVDLPHKQLYEICVTSRKGGVMVGDMNFNIFPGWWVVAKKTWRSRSAEARATVFYSTVTALDEG